MASDKFTSVRLEGAPGYAARGYVTPAQAVTEAQRYYARQLREADAALAALKRGRYRVVRHTGIVRWRNVRQVWPAGEGAGDEVSSAE